MWNVSFCSKAWPDIHLRTCNTCSILKDKRNFIFSTFWIWYQWCILISCLTLDDLKQHLKNMPKNDKFKQHVNVLDGFQIFLFFFYWKINSSPKCSIDSTLEDILLAILHIKWTCSYSGFWFGRDEGSG